MTINFEHVLIKRKLLIVDDMDAMRSIETGSLKSAGFRQVYAENNGRKALQRLQARDIDLIVCDWDMPEMTGLELLQAVRADKKLKHTIFIMVTASDDAPRIKQAIASGVNDYIIKPFQPEQLNYRVMKALRKLEGVK